MTLRNLVLSLPILALAPGCIIVTDGDSGTDGDTDTTTSTSTSSTDGSSSSSDSDSAGTSTGSTSASATGSSSDSSTGGSSSAGSTSATGGAAGCGWGNTGVADPAMGYVCGGEGEDPEGSYALACPEGLTAGDDCGDLTGVGCCDANGDLWYCDANAMLFMESCGG